METKKVALMGVISAVLIIAIDLIFFFQDKIFMFLLGIAFVIGLAPFMLGLLQESKKEEEINEMFLEFSRNLAESVVTGTPISKSIINMSKKNYRALNPHIQKMANQINLGIPVNVALQTFAEDVDNRVIKRAVALIREAEKAGGEIDYILESVAKSIAEVEKLKKERRAAMFNLIMQGYIIFFIFIGIMLVMEFKILPLTYGSESVGGIFGGGDLASIGTGITEATGRLSAEEISRMFLYLLLTQGFFAGLVIGKLSEGSIKYGIKHSFILTIAAFLISTGIRALLA
ncbi:MAG TPA: type II secretion system F family protein [Candidatus Nanoarchaeia archaeon]|nr:type II secretion system F family protein [Candidatus Nanoarchaeia archaeon]